MNSEIPAIDHVASIMNSFLLAIRATYLNFAAFVTNQIQNKKNNVITCKQPFSSFSQNLTFYVIEKRIDLCIICD